MAFPQLFPHRASRLRLSGDQRVAPTLCRKSRGIHVRAFGRVSVCAAQEDNDVRLPLVFDTDTRLANRLRDQFLLQSSVAATHWLFLAHALLSSATSAPLREILFWIPAPTFVRVLRSESSIRYDRHCTGMTLWRGGQE